MKGFSRKTFIGIVLLALGVVCLEPSRPGFAAEAAEQEQQDRVVGQQDRREQAMFRFRELALADEKAVQQKAMEERLLNKIRFSFAFIESFDRNANLDSAHKRDLTQEINFFTTFTDIAFKRLRYQIRYSLNTALHQHFSKNDSFRNDIRGKIDYKINKSLLLDSDYDIQYARFQKSTQSSYWRHRVRVGLEHSPFDTRRISHRPNFTYEYKDYVYRKARITSPGTTTSTINTPNDRKDSIYRIGHEIKIEPFKLLRIVSENEVGFNQSNDQHQDFYDYQYFKTSHTASVSYEKWYTFAGFQFQRRNYHGRRFNTTSSAQWEDLPALYGGIFYAFSEYINLGFNASYVKSDSNFPDLEYQGSTFTLGVYTSLKASEIFEQFNLPRPSYL
ncbi:MAG: hypothetical protein Q8R76_05560 [Candidatus Omnitrophota bacterium]|nr:hypothetical protein [Candidatus Omnitrophota bacterium]